MLSLYIVSILIFVRSVVRVVEYLQGYTGYVMGHEAFLYVFDATVMWLAMITMNWIHPGEVAKEIRTASGTSQYRGVGEEQDKDAVSMDRMPA